MLPLKEHAVTKGAQGARGAQGAKGARGAQGARGPRGLRGSQGFRGTTGSQGTPGSQGFTGAQGANSATGAQGPQGAQGANSSTGAQGAQGFTGPQGPQGMSSLNKVDASSIPKPYIVKIKTLTGTTIGSFVSITDPSGTVISTLSEPGGWAVTFPSSTSIQIVHHSDLSNGLFTNFRRATAKDATTPYTYWTGNFASGSSGGAHCQYTPDTRTLIFGAVNATQYGYSAMDTPIYFMFDLIPELTLP